MGIKIGCCPVCSGKNIEKYWAMRGYRLSRCLDCTAVWDPTPSEHLEAIYSKSYFINDNPKGGYTNYFEGMKINKKTFSDRLRKLEKKLGKKGKLLDVGCALGDCLLEAKRLGWTDTGGVEISEFAAKEAKKRGVKVIGKTVNSAQIAKGAYDVVCYQDVIEHLTDPVTELISVRKILKTNGLVYLVTPDIGGWWSKILRSMWYHYKPGEHLIYFSEKSLRRALEKAGFKKIEIYKTYHVLSIEYIFNRLKFYYPTLFELLLTVVRKFRMRNLAFRAYTGEIEAWGVKGNDK